MFPYTTDSDERKNIPIILVILSLSVTAFINLVISWISNIITFSIPFFLQPLYLSAPLTIAMYFILLEIFDKYLWKWSLLHSLGLIKTPNLNGTWHGYLLSSYSNLNVKHEISVIITQYWSEIKIVLKSDDSQSTSTIAGLLTNDSNCITLYYLYLSEPEPDAAPTMHSHRGTNWLVFDEKRDSLIGGYYTGRDSKNHGKIVLQRLKFN
jgi:hypothetical protein